MVPDFLQNVEKVTPFEADSARGSFPNLSFWSSRNAAGPLKEISRNATEPFPRAESDSGNLSEMRRNDFRGLNRTAEICRNGANLLTFEQFPRKIKQSIKFKQNRLMNLSDFEWRCLKINPDEI